jgi:hypothetical protein
MSGGTSAGGIAALFLARRVRNRKPIGSSADAVPEHENAQGAAMERQERQRNGATRTPAQ